MGGEEVGYEKADEVAGTHTEDDDYFSPWWESRYKDGEVVYMQEPWASLDLPQRRQNRD